MVVANVNSPNCLSSPVTSTLIVNALPNVNAGIDQSICGGQTTTLNASGANQYQWNNGVQNNVPFIPTASVTYTVIGTDLNGCVNTDVVAITVNALPNVSAGLDQTICSGETTTLNASGANQYQWDNGIQNNTPFTPISSTSYSVIGTTLNGCTNTDIVTITVLPNSLTNLTQTAVDSYTLNGQVYTQSGVYTQIIPAANGCDSIITLDLTLSYTGINELNSGDIILQSITD